MVHGALACSEDSAEVQQDMSTMRSSAETQLRERFARLKQRRPSCHRQSR